MNMVETEQEEMRVFSWTGSRPWVPGFAAAAVRLGAPLWLEQTWHNAQFPHGSAHPSLAKKKKEHARHHNKNDEGNSSLDFMSLTPQVGPASG